MRVGSEQGSAALEINESKLGYHRVSCNGTPSGFVINLVLS